MTVKFKGQIDNIIVLEVSQQLKLPEFNAAQSQIEKVIKKIGNIKILILTENFQGWETADGWDDFSFQNRNDSFIDKIAIVGDPEMKDSLLAFAAEGLRPVAIQYFNKSQVRNAKEWLK